MINKYTNKQRGLLAVIMAMVMVFAGAAFVAAEVDAESTALPSAEDGVITLTENVNITVSDSVGFTIAEGQTVKIDLKGYTITGIYNGDDDDTTNKALIVNNGTLTIIDSSTGGKITSNNNMDLIVNNGVLAINGGILDVNCANNNDNTSYPGASALVNNVGGTTTITSVDIDSESIRSYAVINKGTMSISPAQGSTVTVNAAKGAVASDAGTLTVDGGEYVAGTWHALYVSDDASSTDADTIVTVNGGSFTKGTWGHAVADYSDISDAVNSDVKLMGGTFNGSIYVYDKAAQSPGVQVIGGIYSTNVTEYAVNGAKYIVDETMYLKNCVVDESIEIENVTVVTGTALMNAGGSFTISTGITLSELVIAAADGSEVKFNNINTSGEISISNGSVVIGGEIETIGGTIIVKSGTAKVTGSTDVSITVESGATLVVPKDVVVSGKVTNSGTIDLSGQLTNNETGIDANSNSGTIEVNDESAVVKATNSGTIILNKQIGTGSAISDSNGTIAIADGITMPDGIDGTNIVSAESVGNSFGMSKELESDYTVKTNAFLANDLTIPEGVTLTVDGTLNLNGNDLNVLGNLVVSKKGIIEDYKTGGEIVLTETGTVSNEGIIGNTTGVTVSAEKGEVNMKGITGVEFSLTKVKDAGFFLTVSGEAAIKMKESNLLTITEAYIADGFTVKDVQATIAGTILKDATVTIGSKAVVTATITEMQNGSTLIVNGVINGTVNMVNGAEVIINGESDATYIAKTGDFKTYGDDNKKQTAEQATTTDITTIVTGDLKGITISVTTRSYTAQDADKTPMTEQKLLVSGIAAVADGKDKNEKADLTVSGKAYVTEDSELVIPSEVIINTDNIIPAGVLKVIDPTANVVGENDVVGFTGAKYTITVTDEATYDETVTDYYTTFDTAYAAIADADEMTITISGGYKFAKDYIIAAGQTVEAATGEFTITKDGTITIQDEGALDLPKLDVKGILTVIYGADCDVDDLTYEVMSKNTETGDLTYSGAELAIENAVAGDVIDIVNPVTFKDPVTIAEGVTVNVENGASITAEKGLTVAGKLVNEGTVGIADEYDLIVTGEIENEGTITLGTESEMTVTGTVVSNAAISGTINAASYTDEGNTIYTTVASAVASGEDVAVSGKFTENADIVLAEEQTLTINGEVVLDSIRLVAGSNLTVDGKLTADVIAAVGTEETTGALSDAVVDVVKITGITNWTVNYNEAKATYTMVMPAYTSGDAVIEAGSVNYNEANASFGAVSGSNPVAYKTMKVASGATLVVTGNVTDDVSKKYFVNEGTIVVFDSKNFTNVLLGGTVNVDLGKTLTLTTSQIVGDVVLATEEGKTPASVAISGQILIGSTPKTLGAAGSIVGKVTFATANDYVVVFEGSTFDNTDDSVKTLSTAYTINDIAFATIYTTVQNVDVNNINKIVAGLEDLDVVDVMNDTEKAAYESDPSTYTRNYANDITWYSGSSKATTIGQYASVSCTISYKNVSFIVSVGPGLMVYLDDIQNTTGSASLAIGTHTVTVYIDRGYEGTPTITFNGQTITDGKLVLTSDMLGKENKLVVTGATVMQDQPVVIQPSEPADKDEGMDLTDILLIVLVVLIVIMAIIVALRMMRS